MANTMWHMALEPRTSRLQDVIIASIEIDDFDLLHTLLSTENLKGMPVETETGNYLIMYGGEYQRPFPSVIVWRYENLNGESIVVDMQMKDSWVIEQIWGHWLMPEKSNDQYIPPEQFTMMGRKAL